MSNFMKDFTMAMACYQLSINPDVNTYELARNVVEDFED